MPVDLEELLDPMIEDLALASLRLLSWEGALMREVLASHGYLKA